MRDELPLAKWQRKYYSRSAHVSGKQNNKPPFPGHAEGTTGCLTPSELREIPVVRIRPEEGLGRKRDRDGHRELQRSIEQFGVLTPITVRPAPDRSGDYLLIKGQGRTLACRLLGIETIPAVVVDERYAEDEKVQQFLVENVARLKMRPIDRALLIQRARQEGEETAAIARRFGVAPVTVRRLLAQLEGASLAEVASLRSGEVNLGLHAVVTRFVRPKNRLEVLEVVAGGAVKTKELDSLLTALGWNALEGLGTDHHEQRLKLLKWAISALERIPSGTINERLRQLALQFPIELEPKNSARAHRVV